MVAAFFHSHPDAAGAARDLTRALGAALLLAREKVAQAAAPEMAKAVRPDRFGTGHPQLQAGAGWYL